MTIRRASHFALLANRSQFLRIAAAVCLFCRLCLFAPLTVFAIQPGRSLAPEALPDLRAEISSVLHRPDLASAQTAATVISLESGRVLYQENGGKLMIPASNLKLYTVAAALDRLSPDYRFSTSVFAHSRPDQAGLLQGDLIVYGRGDPTFSARFNHGDYYAAIDDLAARIQVSGVRTVAGDLIGDETYFSGPPFGFGWQWTDLQWHYGAEISALSIDDNALDLFIRPGLRQGDPCQVSTGPATSLITVSNTAVTFPSGEARSLAVYRGLGERTIEVAGGMAINDPGEVLDVAMPAPARLFVSLLRTRLEARGIVIRGQTRVVSAQSPTKGPSSTSALIELAKRQSLPLSEIAAQTLKHSQNLYAELLLRTLGKAAGVSPQSYSGEAGILALRNFLQGAGINPSGLKIVDGSGLSRENLISTDATCQLLAFVSRRPWARSFYDALPIAARDGTLRTRMRSGFGAGNIHAKTGTLSNVDALSGYVTTMAGERLAFSLLLNNSVGAGHDCLDQIATILASFSGHS